MPPCPAPAPDDALAALLHDLKTPLMTLSGQLQLARRRLQRMEGPDRDYALARVAAAEAALPILGERIERLGREVLRPGDGEPPAAASPP